jgi:HlyD family secretion protein
MINNRWRRGPLALALGLLAGCAQPAAPRDELQGVVEIHQRVLGFQLPGRLATLEVRRGQIVHTGQILARLDDSLERPQRDGQAAQVAAAQAQLDLVQAGARGQEIRAAEADLRAAQAAETTARDAAQRARTLSAAGASTPQQLDDAEGALSRATAQREATEQRLAGTRAGARSQEIRAAQARLDAARAALALADARLADHVLRAPMDGAILDTHAEPGEILGAGGAVATLGAIDRPYVDLFVPEGDVAQARVGQRAEVHVDSLPGHVFTGAVEDVGQRTEFTPRYLFSPKERPNLVVRVRVDLQDPEHQLHAGLPAMGRLLATSAGPQP